MKKFFLLACAAVLIASCGERKSRTPAELSGMQANDTVLVSYKRQTDTLAAPNGAFTYEFTDSVAGLVSFSIGYPNAIQTGPCKLSTCAPSAC